MDAIEHPVFAASSQNPSTGKPYVQMMERQANNVHLITLLHDKNTGEVVLEDGAKAIHYTVDDEDFEYLKDGLKTNARALFGAGAARSGADHSVEDDQFGR